MRAECANESKDKDRQDVPLCPPEVFADTGNDWSLDDFDELREIGKGKYVNNNSIRYKFLDTTERACSHAVRTREALVCCPQACLMCHTLGRTTPRPFATVVTDSDVSLSQGYYNIWRLLS